MPVETELDVERKSSEDFVAEEMFAVGAPGDEE